MPSFQASSLDPTADKSSADESAYDDDGLRRARFWP